MKRIVVAILSVLFLGIFLSVFAQVASEQPQKETPVFLLLIKEQNIEGPQQAWWVSEIDLSTVEARVSEALTNAGYKVIAPSELRDYIKAERAFQTLNITEDESLKLAKLKNIDYVVLGKAIASGGGRILNSNMRSCFANATVKLIRVSDGKIIAYLDATASSPHTDLITGGKQALAKAGSQLGEKIIKALSR